MTTVFTEFSNPVQPKHTKPIDNDQELVTMEATMRDRLNSMGIDKNSDKKQGMINSVRVKTSLNAHKYRKDGEVPVERVRGLRGALNSNPLVEQLDKIQSTLAAERAMRLHAQRNLSSVQKALELKDLELDNVNKRVTDLEQTVSHSNFAHHITRASQAIAQLASKRNLVNVNRHKK